MPASRNENTLGLDTARPGPDRHTRAALRNPQGRFVDDPSPGALRRDRLRPDQAARADVSGILRLEIPPHSRRCSQKRESLREPRIIIGFTEDPLLGADFSNRSDISGFAMAKVKRTDFPVEFHTAFR